MNKARKICDKTVFMYMFDLFNSTLAPVKSFEILFWDPSLLNIQRARTWSKVKVQVLWNGHKNLKKYPICFAVAE
jgi:hypothetical protein